MKKGWVIGCSVAGAIGLVLALCVGGVALFVTTLVGSMQAVARPADNFLIKLGNGDTTGAYQSGASGLRAAETPESFDAFVKRSRLDQYRSSNWNQFSIVNSQGTLEGTVTLKDGSTVPLKVNLVNEGGWKVLGLELTGGAKATIKQAPPSEEEAKRLVKRDMGEFRKAVEADDFATLHESASQRLKSETTAAGFREAFKNLVEVKADLTGVGRVEPVLNKPPAVDAGGRLQVTGVFPSKPKKVVYDLEYIYESGAWKLSGIEVQVKNAD